jgi:competence protein ComEA
VIPTPISTAFPERPVEPPLPEADVPSTPVPTFAPTPFPTTPALAPGSRININRASATELEALPGIGTVLAARIVQDREANGPFATVEDLKRVRGIGDGIMGKVRDFVEVGP